MKRKVPQRMCIGCSEMRPKKELIRIVRNKDGEIFYDSTGRANGRGAYICKDVECFHKAIKNKKLEQAFGQSISKETIDQIQKEISND